jgi:hypothetical protein
MNGNEKRLAFYHPSGTSPFSGIILTLAAGIAGGSILGAVYAFSNHHDPLIYINILLAGIFGTALGWLLSACVRRFRIRSVAVAAIIGIIAFSAAYAVHWAFYISTVLVDFADGFSSFDIKTIADIACSYLANPRDAVEMIMEINRNGVWSISGRSSSGGAAVSGIALAAIWIAEAVFILYFVVKQPAEQAGKPYSERMDKWLDAQRLGAFVPFVEDKKAFENALASGDFSSLETPMPFQEEGYTRYATVTLYPDPSEPYISVVNTTVSVKKKKRDSSSSDVVKYLKVSSLVAKNISDALSNPPQKPQGSES